MINRISGLLEGAEVCVRVCTTRVWHRCACLCGRVRLELLFASFFLSSSSLVTPTLNFFQYQCI